ncbi:MAG: hypothetical protein GWP91_14650 [Rhodobacterales bacterium]|nr:hypothetical protein [Rhodobacterales bacterium]
MYLMLEAKPVALAMPEHCMTWSGDAKELFLRGIRSWKTVLQEPVLAMQNLHHNCDADLTLYVATEPWIDSQNRRGTLVSLYFATDAVIDRDDVVSLGKPLGKEDSNWRSDGVHPAPEHAFPCLALRDGEVTHVWLEDEQGTHFTYDLLATGNSARSEQIYFGDAGAERFWPHAKHAVGTWCRADDDVVQHREQLKLAFAAKVTQRVVEADGAVGDSERDFLARTFPEDQLKALWLDDLALREALARQAEQELADLLGYHEKLGLLSTFFAACHADGKVDVRELRVLREASRTLGLENADVVKYLQRLW